MRRRTVKTNDPDYIVDESDDELEDYYRPPPKPYVGNGFKITFDSREEKHRFMKKVGSKYLSKL
jgi:hypothetical protein|tara:strand:+ start:3346 stop:3537 length:192 start_codon:yes stop_codon:yes gene_type:complete